MGFNRCVNNVTYSWNCVMHSGRARYTFVPVIVYYFIKIGYDKCCYLTQ